MGYFEILGDKLLGITSTTCNVFGMYLCGIWHLDYSFKLMFDINDDVWNSTYQRITNDGILEIILNNIGVRYKTIDGKIHYMGKVIADKYGKIEK